MVSQWSFFFMYSQYLFWSRSSSIHEFIFQNFSEFFFSLLLFYFLYMWNEKKNQGANFFIFFPSFIFDCSIILSNTESKSWYTFCSFFTQQFIEKIYICWRFLYIFWNRRFWFYRLVSDIILIFLNNSYEEHHIHFFYKNMGEGSEKNFL